MCRSETYIEIPNRVVSNSIDPDKLKEKSERLRDRVFHYALIDSNELVASDCELMKQYITKVIDKKYNDEEFENKYKVLMKDFTKIRNELVLHELTTYACDADAYTRYKNMSEINNEYQC